MSRKKKNKPVKEAKTEFPNLVTALTTVSITDLSRMDIVNVTSGEKTRHSGHFIDQKLKYNKPSDEPPTLFDDLLPETQNKIEEENIERITEGIRLSKTGEKLINSILNLLQIKSNTKINEKNKPADPEKFYTGNLPAQEVKFGGDSLAPMLRITPHELFTEVTGTKDYSGYDIKTYNTALMELSSKQYLIKYLRHRKSFNGKPVIDRVEEYIPLIRIIKYYEGLSKEENKLLDEKDNNLSQKRGEIIIRLNPLFRDQLDTKFILYPVDINKRTEIASGGSHKVTEAITKLRDYLLRALSNKTYTVTINKTNLPYILGLDNYIKESRKKLISQRVEESLQAVKNLGLALEIKKITGAKYQPQYQFILNKDF